MYQREVVVLSGVRTAIGDFGGSLKDIAPTELAGRVVAEAVKRSGLESQDIGHCVIGSVTHSDRRDMYMSRVAALKSGIANCRSLNGLLLISDALTRTARSMRPRRLAVFSDAKTAAAEPSTLTEHISLVLGYDIISAPITSSSGVSMRYIDLGFMVE